MDNDYIILFDENGSPYIAHAFGDRLRSAATSVGNSATSAYGNAKAGVGRGIRATHKYIDKIVENGRTRYFYTQEELKAYYNEKAKPAINKATQNARAATGRAVTAVGDTASNVVAKGKMVTNQAGETARNLAANGKTVAGNVVNRAGETARNVAQNARSARSEATRRAEEALQRGKSSTAQMRSEFRNKAEQAGRVADNAVDRVGEAAKNVVDKGKEVASNVAQNTKNTINAVEERLKGKKENNDLSLLQNHKSQAAKELASNIKLPENQNKHHSREKKIGEGSATVKKGASQGKLNVGNGETSESIAANAKYPVVDPSKVSKEYVYSLASNSGYSKYVKDTMNAEDTLRSAESEYNRLKNNPNTSQAAINKAEKDMQEAKKQYDDLYSELIRKLNSK